MKILLTIVVTFFTLGGQSSYPLCPGFLPEHDLFFPMQSQNKAKGITKEQFFSVVDRVRAVYTPIIQSRGEVFVVNDQWASGYANATASVENGEYWINIYGGLARAPKMTVAGFTAVLCHEIGHHIGGGPKSNKKKLSHYSIEGQSDYFATTKCMRKLFTKNENLDFLASADLGSFVAGECKKSFDDNQKLANCLRSGQAAVDLGHLLKALYRSRPEVSAETPDLTVVEQTIEFHTNPQCRLDTYLQGALCGQPHDIDLSKDDPKVGACWRELHGPVGSRPHCWFFSNEKYML